MKKTVAVSLMVLFQLSLIGGCGLQNIVLPLPAIAPTVSATFPVIDSTNVALNASLAAFFSVVMDPATITTSTFTLSQGGNAVAGSVTYLGLSATFTPQNNLVANTVYTATITSGAKNSLGVALAQDYVWSFTTGTTLDTTRPTVSSTIPADGATGVAFNLKPTVTFSEAMDAATLTTANFTLTGPGSTPVSGVVTYIGNTATFAPSASLAPNTLFTGTIKGGVSGATDLAGNALLADFVWTFTTGGAADTTRPTVLSASPADTAVGVCTGKIITTAFSEAMDASTITTATFTVTGPGTTPLVGTTAYDAITHIASFTKTTSFPINTLITVTLSGGGGGIKDLAGNALLSNRVWTFSTGSQPCSPLAPISIGAAAPFGSVGGSAGMTNSGTLTVINGDIGTTGASTLVTGFHDHGGANVYTETTLNIGNVTGNIYTAPPAPTISDGTEGNATTFSIASAGLAAAQNAWANTFSPAGLPGGTDPNAGQLGGLTLAPGVYKSAGGSFLITGSDLTLDGQGDPDAVWVFQAASTLTVGAPGAPRSIILIGGAQAKNVFWRVGTAATINAAGGGTMVGTIIASAGITFSTAGNVIITTLEGRALGLNASVTMVNTVINVPAP